MAAAMASAAWSGLGISCRPSSIFTHFCTRALSAVAVPETDCFIVFGEYSRWVFDVATQTFSGVYDSEVNAMQSDYVFENVDNSCFLYYERGSLYAHISVISSQISDNNMTFSLGVSANSGGMDSAINAFKNSPIEFYAFGGVL
jgi:hypothetical protein